MKALATGFHPSQRSRPSTESLTTNLGRAGAGPTLASEDLKWRRDNNGRILERLFNVNVYFKAYQKFWLDQHAELARWRAKGVRTPSAPPRQSGE